MLKNLLHMFRTYSVTFRYLKKVEISFFLFFFLSSIYIYIINFLLLSI